MLAKFIAEVGAVGPLKIGCLATGDGGQYLTPFHSGVRCTVNVSKRAFSSVGRAAGS